MALQLSYTNPRTGVVAVNAYHKIVEIRVFSLGDTDSADIWVGTYSSSAWADDHAEDFAVKRKYNLPSFDLSQVQNATTTAYTFLKTQPDFTGAVDT